MTPLVSVVMPVRNCARYLRESINSILNQTWRDFELIVVDDASIDDTAEILRSYKDERIVGERNVNQLGPGQARNRGISRARGEYIACMDADDVALPRRLELQVDFLRKHSEVVLVGGAATTIDPTGNPIETHYPLVDPELIQLRLPESNCFVQSTVMMRSKAVRQLGGYRFPLAEDYDLWLRMADHYKLTNLSVPIVLYRSHGTQTSIQQIEDLTMWIIAARHAARARRNGASDQMSGIESISATVLENLGVSQAEIHNALADAFLLRLNVLIQLKKRAEAIRQTRQLRESESISTELRKDIAARTMKLARDYYAQQQYETARVLTKLSVKLDPQLLATPETLRLVAKSALGVRGTSFVRGLKSRLAPPESTAT